MNASDVPFIFLFLFFVIDIVDDFIRGREYEENFVEYVEYSFSAISRTMMLEYYVSARIKSELLVLITIGYFFFWKTDLLYLRQGFFNKFY